MYSLRHFLHFQRSFSSAPTNIFEQLTNRALIRISGNESSQFLQGLITNDMNHLEHGMGCMFTMFLNVKGRVLFDTIIYKTAERDTFFVECDAAGIDTLCKHLKMYRVRRKIDIDDLREHYNIFSVFNAENIETIRHGRKDGALTGLIVPCDVLKTTLPDSSSTKVYRDLLIYRDPRISYLGSRVIALKSTDAFGQISDIVAVKPGMAYRWFRYCVGVGEGSSDLPPGDCFPLEANCDYLHGVSFHKGCYIGQELTARTHHTGVVRKRLMPLYFTKTPSRIPEDNRIIDKGNNLGKLRGVEGDVGLGLLRIDKALECGEFSVGDGIAQTVKPNWWPVEAPKERITLGKG